MLTTNVSILKKGLKMDFFTYFKDIITPGVPRGIVKPNLRLKGQKRTYFKD
jgi:hypothetical protein